MEGPTGGAGGGEVRWVAGHTGLEGSRGPSICLSVKQRWFSQETSGKDKCTTCTKALSLVMQYKC